MVLKIKYISRKIENPMEYQHYTNFLEFFYKKKLMVKKLYLNMYIYLAKQKNDFAVTASAAAVLRGAEGRRETGRRSDQYAPGRPPRCPQGHPPRASGGGQRRGVSTIGDDLHCVQRHAGGTPVGVSRWADTAGVSPLREGDE